MKDITESASGGQRRTDLRRHPERGRDDRATIEQILDEGFICHVGFTTDHGPVVIPTAYARVGEALVLHGALGNAMLRAVARGEPLCVTVTLVDGLVLARSAFHHSINYRSVVCFGRGEEIADPHGKAAALAAIVEHLVPGRSADARGPNRAELDATRVVRIPLSEVSAKVRSGDPIDDPEDVGLDVWAGQLPLRLVVGPPIADRAAPMQAALPRYVETYARPAGS